MREASRGRGFTPMPAPACGRAHSMALPTALLSQVRLPQTRLPQVRLRLEVALAVPVDLLALLVWDVAWEAACEVA